MAPAAAVAGRFADGVSLLDEIGSGVHDGFVAALPVGDPEKDVLRARADDLAAWFGRLYSAPGPDDGTAWVDSRLEYRFQTGAPTGAPGGGEVM